MASRNGGARDTPRFERSRTSSQRFWRRPLGRRMRTRRSDSGITFSRMCHDRIAVRPNWRRRHYCGAFHGRRYSRVVLPDQRLRASHRDYQNRPSGRCDIHFGRRDRAGLVGADQTAGRNPSLAPWTETPLNRKRMQMRKTKLCASLLLTGLAAAHRGKL